MINAIMQHLTYDDPPSYSNYPSYRQYLRKASHYSCAYCTISESESPGATFNIEHFRPEALFRHLSSTCTNLRYACPRCNSYKGKLWIPIEEGCIRDCENCERKICHQNIERFIDVLSEEPSTMLSLGEDNKIYASFGSKPADYTIKYLRLNRDQLVKLRYVRRFMENWQNELLERKEAAEKRLATIKKEQQSFLAKNISSASAKEETYLKAMNTLYEMLVLLAEQSLLQIEDEIRKLNQLQAYRAGSDTTIEE